MTMNDRMHGSSGLLAAYAGDPAGPRYQAWREEICRGFCRLDVEPSKGGHIDCKVEISQISSLALGRGSGTSGRFLRSRDLLPDSCDDLVLVAAISGRVLVVQE